MSNRYLITMEANWADEFDIYSAAVINDNQMNTINDERVQWPVTFWFGTNQQVALRRNDFQDMELPVGLVVDLEALGWFLARANLDDLIISAIDRVNDQLYELENPAPSY